MRLWNTEGPLCTVLLGTCYVSLAATRVLTTRSLSREKGYAFLPMTVNVQAEFVKLLVCGGLALRLFAKGKESISELTSTCSLQFLKWSLPGFLYFLDNLLTFYILARLSPAVAILLGNFVIITTAVLFRLVLKRKLTSTQWASLGILFLAIVSLSNQSKLETSQHHGSHSVGHAVDEHPLSTSHSDKCLAEQRGNVTAELAVHASTHKQGGGLFAQYEGHMFVLASCCLSSLANIYNEKILKENNGMEESIYVQNSKLYLFGIFFSSLSLILFYHNFLFDCGFYYGYSQLTLLLVIVVASLGLTVSLILKYRDNMFHILASQMTTVTVITVSWLVHDFEPTLNFFLLAPIVLLAMYLYVVNKDKQEVVTSEQ